MIRMKSIFFFMNQDLNYTLKADSFEGTMQESFFSQNVQTPKTMPVFFTTTHSLKCCKHQQPVGNCSLSAPCPGPACLLSDSSIGVQGLGRSILLQVLKQHIFCDKKNVVLCETHVVHSVQHTYLYFFRNLKKQCCVKLVQ